MSSSIYNVNYPFMVEQLLPPSKRKAVTLAYMKVFAKSFQFQRDILFDLYADGFAGAKWTSGASWNKGDRTRYIDHAVYEALDTIAPHSITPNLNPSWERVTNIWIGIRERAKYTGNKLVLTYALNKWFDTVFRQPNGTAEDPIGNPTGTSDIYIVNNVIVVNQFQISDVDVNSSFIAINEGLYGVDGIPIQEIANNPNAFTIFVPIAVFNSLASTNPEREKIIRAFADKYVTAGIIYNITTY